MRPRPRGCRRWRTTRVSKSTRSAAGPASGRRASPDPGRRDEQNNAALIAELAGVPDAQRTARYRCVLALVRSASRPAPDPGAGQLGGTHRLRAGGQRRLRLRPLFHSRRPQLHGGRTQCGAQERAQPPRRGAARPDRAPGHMGAELRRRSRCTCTFRGACASARTAISIRTRCTASCRSRPTSRPCSPISTRSWHAVGARTHGQHVPGRRDTEPVHARRAGAVLFAQLRARARGGA